MNHEVHIEDPEHKETWIYPGEVVDYATQMWLTYGESAAEPVEITTQPEEKHNHFTLSLKGNGRHVYPLTLNWTEQLGAGTLAPGLSLDTTIEAPLKIQGYMATEFNNPKSLLQTISDLHLLDGALFARAEAAQRAIDMPAYVSDHLSRFIEDVKAKPDGEGKEEFIARQEEALDWVYQNRDELTYLVQVSNPAQKGRDPFSLTPKTNDFTDALRETIEAYQSKQGGTYGWFKVRAYANFNISDEINRMPVFRTELTENAYTKRLLNQRLPNVSEFDDQYYIDERGHASFFKK